MDSSPSFSFGLTQLSSSSENIAQPKVVPPITDIHIEVSHRRHFDSNEECFHENRLERVNDPLLSKKSQEKDVTKDVGSNFKFSVEAPLKRGN